MRIKLVGINARFTHSCLALFYVRNELAENCKNVEVHIEQYTVNDPYYQLLVNITASNRDYYFFSASIWNSDLITNIIKDILQIDEGCVCVVGGPQAEIIGKAIGNKKCVIVVGEIERINKKFYQDLKEGKLEAIYKCTQARINYSSPYLEADFDSHLLNKHIYYETSRGCPFSCTYCLSSTEKGIYHKDLALVTSELKSILRFNPLVLRFVDRTFNDNPSRALSIWRFLAEQDCDTHFHFEISPERFSEAMFTFLESVPPGKFQFEIGIQSTNVSTLEAVKRRIDTGAAHKIIYRLSSMGNIHLHVDLILGLPFETEKTFLRSFKDVYAMNPHYIQMGLLKILPDTPICHTAPENNYVYSGAPPYSVFSNVWINHVTMQNLYWFSECVERFMNNRYFVSLWEYFRTFSVDIVEFFQDILRLCKDIHFFQRAPTQELLCYVILDWIEGRFDKEYIVEILRYDWLRCGHRFLPDRLEVEESKVSRNLKKKIFHNLSDCESSLKNETEKLHYLKKGFVAKFSGEFIKNQGYTQFGGQQFLCFIVDREETLRRYSKVAQFSLPHDV